MFSCVVAGRLPLPPPLQVDETHAVFQLEQADQINHVVVFMTGSQPFPEGYGATVHLMWPRADGSEAPWQMLGWYVAGSPSLLNTKPSAIFRVRGTDAPAAAGGAPARTATLGISIEPLEQVERQMQAMPGKAPASDAGSTSLALASRGAASGAPAPLAAQLAVPIAQNLFDYLSSFAPDSAPQAVPLLQRWLEQFQRKLQAHGVEFLTKAN